MLAESSAIGGCNIALSVASYMVSEKRGGYAKDNLGVSMTCRPAPWEKINLRDRQAITGKPLC